jgi:hypothetical protein
MPVRRTQTALEPAREPVVAKSFSPLSQPISCQAPPTGSFASVPARHVHKSAVQLHSGYYVDFHHRRRNHFRRPLHQCRWQVRCLRVGATDLVAGDTNGARDIFIRDTCAGVSSGCAPSTVRVSVALDGTQGNGDSSRPVIGANGRFVVFISAAKLGPGGSNTLVARAYLARR